MLLCAFVRSIIAISRKYTRHVRRYISLTHTNFIICDILDMPKRPGSLRRTQSQADILGRWSEKGCLYSIDQLSDDDFGVEMKPDVFDNDEKPQD